ncbi:hypothetical protein I352_03185 [Cryptococcus deuterogattii MMRL2647]|nr:hypothetical protein I352_03185 [Cryptococcus deuterogattii MMRL2647]
MAPIIHSPSWILPDPTPTSRPSSTSFAGIFSTQSKYVMTNLPSRRVYVTEKLPSSSTSATSTSILAKAVATTHLSWWQLLALVLGAFLVLVVGIWLWWRHRKKVKVEEAKKKEGIEERERKRIESEKQKELVERMRGIAKGGKGKNMREESESDSEMWSESETETDTGSESDDSISDGGTIRPSWTRRRKVKGRGRRKRRRGRHKFGHRRRGETESTTETDYSDETYYPRRHQDRDRGSDKHRARRRDRYWKKYSYDPYYDRSFPHPHRDHPQSPVPPAPSIPQEKRRKIDTFRDSVFSSYNSMKRAAVRLKYVEAKVKLKKQLEEEEKLEKIRRDKVKDANKEFERADREGQDRKGSSGLGKTLIPRVNRPEMSHSGSTSSSSAAAPIRNPYFQTVNRDGSLDTIQRNELNTRQIYPGKNSTMDKIRPQLQPQRTGTNSSENSLGGEITHLLGGGSKIRSNGRAINPAPPFRPPTEKVSVSKPSSNAFQAMWLSHPPQSKDPGIGSPPDALNVPETARTNSVYLPVTHPKDRPIIPKGELASAPTGKKKRSLTKVDRKMENATAMSGNGFTGIRSPEKSSFGFAGVGAGANVARVDIGESKWAGRLRERMKIDS